MYIEKPFWSPADCAGFLLDWDGVIAETSLDFSGLREKYYGGRSAMLLEEAGTLSEEVRGDFFRELKELEMAGAEKAVPVAGAFELVEWLKSHDIPYCILSRNCMDVIRRGAKQIGFELPEMTWGRDNMRWVKPDPKALTEAASIMGAGAGRCVYIGDFLYDLQGARRAGMRAILVQRDEEAWHTWADAVYPKLTELVDELNDPKPLVPWEYKEIFAKKGERWLVNASQLCLDMPDDPSPNADCWLLRAAALGVGAFCIAPDKVMSPDDWKKSASFPTSDMGMPWIEAAGDFLATRFPLVDVMAESEDSCAGPKNSLDIMRFIERKRFK